MSIDAGTVAAYLTLDTNKYTSSLQAAKQQMTTFMDDTKTAGERVTALGSGLTTVGTTLLKGVTLPLAGVGTAITLVSVKFDTAMSEVKAISGATGEEFDMLRDKARELGESTRFSATEAANGMANLASAGFTTSEIIAAMPGLLDLAVSGNVDLASASDIAASTLRGFGLEATETAHVADVLARAAADTNAGITDTGDAMKYVAPVANAMGHSLESVTAAVGLLSNAGIKGGQAGTVLRSALARLASPSKEASDLMNDLGFNAYDTTGKMLTLSGIINSLEISMVGLTEQERQNAITTIFGQEAMSGMLTLIQAGPDELDRLTASLKSCDGAASEMAEIMGDNLQGQITELKSKLEGISITLGETLVPVVSDFVGGIKTAVDAFAELNPETQELIVKMGLAAAAAGPLLTVGGKLISGVGTLIPKVSALGSTLYALTGPVGIVVGLVGAGAVVAWNKYKKSQDEARQEMLSMGETLSELSGKVKDASDKMTSAESLEKQWRELNRTMSTCTEGTEQYTSSKEELAKVGQKLVELSGGLITQYDIENGQLETQLPFLQEKLRVEKELADIEWQSSLRTADVQGMVNAYRDLNNQQAQLTERYNEQSHACAQIQTMQKEYLRIRSDETISDGERTQAIHTLQKEYVALCNSIGLTNVGIYDMDLALKELNKSMGETKDELETVSGEYTTAISNIGAFSESLEKAKSEGIITTEAFDEMAAVLNVVIELLGGKFNNTLEDDLADVTSGTNELTKSTEASQKAFEDLKKKYDDGKISVDEYLEKLGEQKAKVAEATKGNATLTSAFKSLSDQINDEILGQIDELTDSTSSLMTEAEKLTDVIKEQTEHGKLSNNTIMDMIGSGYALALQIDEETGAVTLNADEYMRLTNAKLKVHLANIELEKSTIIKKMEEESGLASESAANFYKLAEAKFLAARAENAEDLAALETEAEIIRNLMDNLGNVTNSYKSASSARKKAAKDENKALEEYLALLEHEMNMGLVTKEAELARRQDALKLAREGHQEEKKLREQIYSLEKDLRAQDVSDREKSADKIKKIEYDIHSADSINEYHDNVRKAQYILLKEMEATSSASVAEAEKYKADMEKISESIVENEKSRSKALLDNFITQSNEFIKQKEGFISKQKELDGLLMQDGSVFHFTAEDEIRVYHEILAENQKTIDEILKNGEKLTNEEKELLKQRAANQQSYHDKIRSLSIQAAQDFENANKKLIDLNKDVEKQLEDANKKYADSVEKIRDKLNSDLNKGKEDYLKNVASLNKKLADEEKKLTDAFESELDSRANSITNFVGIFNEVTKKDITGQQLLDNLRDQLDTIKDWQENLAALSSKGIDDSLLEELQDLGPSAASEIAALNTLTKEELDEYVGIYREKAAIAREEATSQMEQQRIEMQRQLQQLRADIDAEMTTLNQEYAAKMAEFNSNASKELAKLRTEYDDTLLEINKNAKDKVNELCEIMTVALAALAVGLGGDIDEETAAVLEAYTENGANILALANKKAKEFAEIEKQKTNKVQDELKQQEKDITKSSTTKRGIIRDEQIEQGTQEKTKTANTQTEANRQEAIVLETAQNNMKALWSFVPEWQSVGRTYGDALLQGIQGTRDRIQSYLADVAAAVREAEEGNDRTIHTYATGTLSAASGLALVGEYGMPEIVDFSGGEQVLNFRESIALMSRAASVAEEYSETLLRGFSNSGGRDYEKLDYDKLGKAVASALGDKIKPSISYSPTYQSPKPTTIAEQRRADKLALRRMGFNF